MMFPNDFIKSLPLNEERVKSLITALSQEPILSLRVNPNKDKSGRFGEKVPWCKTGIYLEERPKYIEDPLFHAGTYYPQEASSMFLEHIISPFIKPGINVLDLCAAPGGKSTHLLSILPNDALLVSNEVIKSRAQILKENVIKWGKSNAIVTQNDAQDFKKLPNFFDIIVIDAPCSGEGMFRKNPLAVNEWSSNNVELCSSRQKRIVADVWQSLKENGILIYSTCTFNRKENEENLMWLSDNFEAMALNVDFPSEWGIEKIQEPNLTAYRFFPGEAKGEGFFMAAFQKKSGKADYFFPKKNSGLNALKTNPFLPFVTLPETHLLTEFGGEICAFPIVKSKEAVEVVAVLYPILLGCAIGEVINGKVKFAHDIALSCDLNILIPKIELDLHQAQLYLGKHDVNVPIGQNGWVIFTFQNVNLGFGKVIGNRINNYYPSYYRIRKNI